MKVFSFIGQEAALSVLEQRSEEALELPGAREADRDVTAVDSGTVDFCLFAAVHRHQRFIKLKLERGLYAVQDCKLRNLLPLERI